MILELHIIQNFAPANLNRDDMNAPKDCEFGGYRRARVSSQCQKRAIREYFKKHDLIDKKHRAERTKRLAEAVAKRLTEEKGRDRAAADRAAEAAVTAFLPKSEKKEEHKTPYLLFLGESEVARFADLVDEHFDAFSASPPPAAPGAEAKPAKGRGRGKPKAEGPDAPEGFAKAAEALLDGGQAADLALFGRMLADLPEKNVDAACQVAHAVSTNAIHSMEMDYYTAVDDLKPNDTAGADMIGTVEFNSACFYRYANLDLGQLAKNLKDGGLQKKTVEAFLKAVVRAIPTGKQNTFAAHNPPSLVFAVVRDGPPVSLANAFVRPVTVERGKPESLVEKSVAALDNHYGRHTKMFGFDGLKAAALACCEEVGTANFLAKPDAAATATSGSVDEVIARVVGAAFPAQEAA